MPSLSGEFHAEFVALTASIVDELARELAPEHRAAVARRLADGFANLWGGWHARPGNQNARKGEDNAGSESTRERVSANDP